MMNLTTYVLLFTAIFFQMISLGAGANYANGWVELAATNAVYFSAATAWLSHSKNTDEPMVSLSSVIYVSYDCSNTIFYTNDRLLKVSPFIASALGNDVPWCDWLGLVYQKSNEWSRMCGI